MDSVTHIALGAVIGEAIMGKRLGKKAMMWCAVAQSAPDIDFIASLFMDPTANLLAHRGFTHSILFCLLSAAVFSILAHRHYASKNIPLRRWLLFLLLQL